MPMNPLIEDHLEWMAGESYSPRTITDRRKLLALADRRLPRGIDDVCCHDLRAFRDTADWTRWTAHTYWSHLVGFYRWAYSERELTCDPTAGLRPPPCGQSRPRPITAADLYTALHRSADPWHTAIMLAVGAGLRAMELAEIRREDITAEHVHVRLGKGGKERWVDTCDSLWAYVQDRPPGLLIRRPYGRTVTARWLSSAQRKHWLSIGLPRLHLHRLRHTFCTTMLQAGNDSLVLRDLMGHASVATTQIYGQPAAHQRRKAVSALDALLAGAPAGSWPAGAPRPLAA